ncbi:MAG: hypothetical protein LUO84_05215 [Methanomassiliicoccales archaeon]|nr:hypothetical protein [Methanomassiliicoccales archaeon]
MTWISSPKVICTPGFVNIIRTIEMTVKKRRPRSKVYGPDEEAAMRSPTKFRCHRCRKVFSQGEGDLFREDSIGYFYCNNCQKQLEEEGHGKDRSKVFKM